MVVETVVEDLKRRRTEAELAGNGCDHIFTSQQRVSTSERPFWVDRFEARSIPPTRSMLTG